MARRSRCRCRAGSSSLGSATPLAPVPVPPVTGPGRPSLTPFEAFRSGTQALRQGKTDQGVEELEFAAEQGVPGAIWKLGRMYADGDGVGQDKARAFEYFRRLTNAHGDSPGHAAGAFRRQCLRGARAVFTSKAFPAPSRPMPMSPTTCSATPLRISPIRKRSTSSAGSTCSATASPKDPMQAARWLRLAANKGEYRAQALLGAMLFKGEEVPRQAALGLFWLIVANEGAGADDGWITDTYSKRARPGHRRRTSIGA